MISVGSPIRQVLPFSTRETKSETSLPFVTWNRLSLRLVALPTRKGPECGAFRGTQKEL
jgi:hypothetical protein